ncbi:MAG: 3-ketoacyl-ACP reductase [Gammaproteobacteria bacterium RIFCSPLOWO2_02_FULL_61_13]|nr:MAG: 3-ketoacyl-ACP reductase [Gammaproteobacteria bacterium RIFCSPLOWO2_02_FULL_61_13]
MSANRLKSKVAIVTGSGQGIGQAIARVFAAEGAKVVIATRTPAHGEATLKLIRDAGYEATHITTDVGDVEQCTAVVEQTVRHYGRIDILVHNAASFLGGSVADYSEEDLETVLSVNLKACFRLSKACIPHLRKQGGGRLLFTSSVTGPRVAMPGTSYYAASKAGVNGFIRTAALELARDAITVNGVEPGYIKTPAMDLLADAEGQKQMAKYVPMGYIGDPSDIAYAMLFLASDEARYVTGQTIVVDGGSTLPESPAFLDDVEGMKGLQGS